MTVKGIVFDSQTMTPKAFARAMERVLSDGILEGCAVTGNESIVTVAKGFYCIKGRTIEVDEATQIETNPGSDYADGYGRIKLILDMTRASTSSDNNQAYIDIEYAASNSFPALTQNDINDNGTVYEVSLGIIRFANRAIQSITQPLGNVALKESYTAGRALITDSTGAVGPSNVTSQELSYLSGATQNIQNALNAKQKTIPHGTTIPSGLSEGDYFILITTEEE